MSAVSITSLGVSQTPASTDPCQNYKHSFKIVWDTSVAPITYPLTVFPYFLTTQQVTREVTAADLTSTSLNLLTFDVTYDIPRSSLGIATAFVQNPTQTELASTTFTPVSKWEILNVSATTDVNGLGTITVNTLSVQNSAFLGIEISIDNINFFSTNTIAGVSPGDYTVYVRDIYGCVKTQSVTINVSPAFESYNSFDFVSLLNPVPFTSVNSLRPSFNNTPSYRLENVVPNKYEFLQTDVLSFQFRSNYDINKVYLINCGEVFQELTVQQRSLNLNQRDIRDAIFYFQDGFLYAYYDGTGNIYNAGGNIIGPNNLNGELLFDQVQGELLSIETLGIIEILEVVEVDNIGQVMKLNYNQPVNFLYHKITTYYNADNFEVYEFELPLAINPDDYQIVIVTSADNEFDDLNPLASASYISEVITVVEEFTQPKFKLVWKNSENNQMSWDTEIECYNYMPKSFDAEFQPKDENEIYTTDTTTFMLESEVYDVFKFVIHRVSQITARQLMFIVSNDFLKIDDNFYVKEETPEVERLGVTNSYNVTLTLTLASNYNSNEREGITRNANTANTDGFLRLY